MFINVDNCKLIELRRSLIVMYGMLSEYLEKVQLTEDLTRGAPQGFHVA
jgi:hypothetical protein